MAFKSVFRILQEVFPEIDLRILKAVAIEHSKDADAAVEFILSDVIPIISAAEPSYTPDIGYITENSIAGGQTIASEAISGPSDVGPKSSHEASEEGSHEYMSKINFWLSDHEVMEQNENLLPYGNEIVSDKKTDATSNPNFNDLDAFVSALLSSDQVSDPGQVKAVASTELLQISQFVADERESQDADAGEYLKSRSQWTLGEENSNYTSALLSLANDINVNHEKLGAKMENGVKDYANILDGQLSGSLKNESTIQNLCNLEVNYNPINVLNLFHKIACASDFNSDSVKPQAEESTPTKASPLLLEEKGPSYMVQDVSKLLKFENETAASDDGTHITTIALQPDQITEINVLNSYTNEAINTKENLVSALNSASDLLKEVEIHEERAKQAKEAASSAGQDILTKVEDLCRMVNNAKEKNEKSAGEIHGEKSILSAETRELQSRLVSISDDKDKYLSMMDEIHRTLEARISAAEKERVEAEKEKLEKEESAQKAFDEQKAILDSILEESQRLQQEAEENAKLRDFLMDRGHIIDNLKGEIVAVYEDVMSLKRRVEYSVQIKKPESSGTMSLESQLNPFYEPTATSFAKASLSEGANHAPVFENTEQANSMPKQLNPESSSDTKSYSDDEWEIFNM